MAAGHAFCLLARTLSREPNEWWQSARHGQSAGPQSGQSRPAHGGPKSPHEPQLSRSVLSPHAQHTGASESDDGHGPQTGDNALSHAEGKVSTLSSSLLPAWVLMAGLRH